MPDENIRGREGNLHTSVALEAIMRFARLAGMFCAVLLPVLGTGTAAAQTTTAAVTGMVTDQSGAAIAGASIVLENLQTHVELTAKTNSVGFYRVAGLLPGFYRATVTMRGFKSVVHDGIELHGQDEIALNYGLQVGSVSESVTVTGGEPLLQSESATVSTVIEQQQIENTPLNGRNVMNLAALTPGVVPQGATSGNPLNNQAAIGNYTNPAGWDNYQIGGAVTGENLVYVDGAPLNLPTNNWMGFIPTQDAIQEFRVETNNISSEFGEYYGGVLLFTTKSGTNEVHGSAYEYFRNTVLDANNYFNNQTGIKRPPVTQNQYGATLGGPLKKNKLFLFGSWEGYANRTGLPYQTVVPTAAETTGDFTADPAIINNFTGQQVSCNGVPNKVCPDPTALYMASVYKYWPQPNIPNVPHGAINFSTNASSGGNSNQYVFRGDYSVNPHQQLFARYTLWKTHTLGTNYYHNNVPQPEIYSTTDQAVVGDTITLNATTVADVRASYLRFLFTSEPPFLGHVNLSDFGSAYGALQNQVTYDTLPVPFLAGYGNQFPILIINVIQFYNYDKYHLSANVTKTFGRNALKAGLELMRNDAFLGGAGGLGPAGIFLFVNGFPTTDIFANFMLGNFVPASPLSNIATSRNTSSINLAQGYYANDTYQMNSRVTLTGGIRWDLPGAILEKHDVNTVFLPGVASPLGTINNPVTGQSQALKGNLALVHSSAYPSRYDDNLHYHLFAPNLGFTVRVMKDTVVRGGFGMSFISYTNNAIPSPFSSPITQSTTPAVGTLSNPFPQIGGVLPQPIGRNPNFAAGIQGLAVTGNAPGIAESNNPYAEQWNLNIQHELSSNSVFQIGYQGSKGTHLRAGLSPNLNELPDQYAAQAATQYQQLVSSGQTPGQADAQTFLNVQVTNPLAGKLAPGSAYNGQTIAEGQLLKPYPQFATGVTEPNLSVGTSIYHSLQSTYQVRFQSAGTFLAAYTWAKLIGTVDSHTGFLEGNTVGGIQDSNNLKAERSLESFDVPQRLVLNYSLALPIGKGQHWMPGASEGLNRLVGGWRLSSITSFQTGYPLALSAQANDLSNSFGAGTIRPDRVSGCAAKISGGATSRLNKWFNTSCFVQPPTPFSFGNEGRVDSQLRGQGVDNWDLALAKETGITERVRANFEAEFLNAFNRVQFAPPGLQVGSSTFGVVSGTLNNPREIQFSFRLLF
jgi:hypothetical protein